MPRVPLRLAQPLSVEELAELRDTIRDITRRAKDRHGYIDYDHAYDYACEMMEYLKEMVPVLLEMGLLMEAFKLTTYAFTTYVRQKIDDSDGGTWEFLDACEKLWEEQIAVADEKQRKIMFAWFEKNQESVDYAEDTLESFRLNAFHDRPLVERNLALVDEKITRLEKNSADRISDYHLAEAVNQRLRLMEALGASQKELDAHRAQYFYLYEVRKARIAKYLEFNDTGGAIDLLRKSRELDRENPRYLEENTRMLIELYEKTCQVDAWREELSQFVLQFPSVVWGWFTN